MQLSETQTKILIAALQHADSLALPPNIPAGARQKVGQALLTAGLVTQVDRPADDAAERWTIGGEAVILALTDAGRAAVAGQGAVGMPQPNHAGSWEGEDQDALQGAHSASQAPRRRPVGLREAAIQVLASWNDPGRPDVDGAVDALRAALAGKPPRPLRDRDVRRKPREGTKQEQVLEMLRRPEGATIAQVIDATGWQQHTVRGFFAGLKKRQGIEVTALERVKQVGPNNTGAKGSYSIYRVADAG